MKIKYYNLSRSRMGKLTIKNKEWETNNEKIT